MISPGMEARLDEIEARHTSLVERAADPSFADLGRAEREELQRSLGELRPVVEARAALRAVLSEAAELDAMARDPSEDEEMRSMAREELRGKLELVPGLERALATTMIPKDFGDDRDAVLEVRAGTGGEEACLFAAELLEMYRRLAERHGWTWDVVSMTASDRDGVRQAEVAVGETGRRGGAHGGASAARLAPYGALRFESGVHRVQRVPATESGGRLHTSAASVAVLPAAGEFEVDLDESQVRVDVMRASGAGGQHVNTTNSAVRLTHEPTGIVVYCQEERSQHKNKAKAFKVLRARIFELERAKALAKEAADRKSQVGSGDRSERVRTYNFPQKRVTDHRIGLTSHDLDGVLKGNGLDDFIDALRINRQSELLAQIGAQLGDADDKKKK